MMPGTVRDPLLNVSVFPTGCLDAWDGWRPEVQRIRPSTQPLEAAGRSLHRLQHRSSGVLPQLVCFGVPLAADGRSLAERQCENCLKKAGCFSPPACRCRQKLAEDIVGWALLLPPEPGERLAGGRSLPRRTECCAGSAPHPHEGYDAGDDGKAAAAQKTVPQCCSTPDCLLFCTLSWEKSRL